MKRIKPLLALLAVIVLATTVACDPDEMFDINVTVPSDTIPMPNPQPVSLVGTAWEGVLEDDGYIDKSVLHFVTDSTGTEYTWIGTSSQTIVEETCDIVYYFDGFTLEGAYYANTPYGQGSPFDFTYSLTDTTLTTQANGRIYHLLQE